MELSKERKSKRCTIKACGRTRVCPQFCLPPLPPNSGPSLIRVITCRSGSLRGGGLRTQEEHTGTNLLQGVEIELWVVLARTPRSPVTLKWNRCQGIARAEMASPHLIFREKFSITFSSFPPKMDSVWRYQGPILTNPPCPPPWDTLNYHVLKEIAFFTQIFKRFYLERGQGKNQGMKSNLYQQFLKYILFWENVFYTLLFQIILHAGIRDALRYPTVKMIILRNKKKKCFLR